MLYGELGIHPLSVSIKSRMIGFWQHMINGKQDKISNRLYSILLAIHNRGFFHCKWLMYIKCILTDSGKEHVWLNQVDVPSNISKNGKQKSLGRATSRSRSQPPTPRGREKVKQINVCIANKQLHDKQKD